MGRLPVVATLEDLDEDARSKSLLTKKRAFEAIPKLFEMDDVRLEFREDALRGSESYRA